jgi:hypothetical protein
VSLEPADLPPVAATPGGQRVLAGAPLVPVGGLADVDADAVRAVVVTGSELDEVAARELRQLRRAGVVVIEVDPPRRTALRRTDLQVATAPEGRGDLLLPTFDPMVTNPVGWSRDAPQRYAVPLHRPPEGELPPWPEELSDDVAVIAGPDLPPDARRAAIGDRRSMKVEGDADLADRLRRVQVVVHDPAWETDARASLRTQLHALAKGTPVVTTADAPAAQLGLPVVAVDGPDRLWDAAASLAHDPDRRERVSVVARREVLLRHAGPARLARLLEAAGAEPVTSPRLSVVLATNRGAFLEHGIRNVLGQSIDDLELVLCLHGPDVPDPDPAWFAARPDVAVQVLRLPQELHLGELLNAGADAATGRHVAKMDDDDWYGRDHLTDLRLAIGYSGADLVGKRIDHIYLAPIDRTITRRRSAPERERPHVSGPTLFARRDTIRRIRFAKLTGPEDSDFQRRLLADGGRIYGTHSLDVVLHRHGGNTWDADAEALLAEAERDVAGLDLDGTASAPGAFVTA